MPGLANAARLTVNETQEALKELTAPDPWSRTKEMDGRRLVEVEGGWLVVNGAKYRDMLSKEDRREYKRAWQAEYRKRKRETRRDGICEGARQAIKEGLNGE